MPIYTYRCENCGVQFDHRQSFSDAPLTRCPECSKKTLRKVYQPVGIVFKGSGFYATDNRSPSGDSHRNSKTSDDESKAASKDSKDEKESKDSKDSKDRNETAPTAPAETKKAGED